MSVAFRRESDEEHLEPKFEIPLPAGANLVTSRGLVLLEAQVAAGNARVASAPDDGLRDAAKRDLRYWNTRLATARIAPPPLPDCAGIGTRVTFRLNGKARTIDIVGHDEAEPASGLLAYSAPLARAMIGAGVGDVIDFAGVAGAIEIVTVDSSA